MYKIKQLVLVSSLIVILSCSTNNNSNSTPVVIPVAPYGLTGNAASTTQINLSWTDNSTNETGFKIERKSGTGNYVVIGTTAADITSFNDTGLTPSTVYTYRVYSFNMAGNSSSFTNEIALTTDSILLVPTLTTTAVSSIATTTAVSGGTISSDGGATISARGVCWSTNANPTIALSTKTNDGIGTGVFVSSITGLIANTTYYLKAYATNSVGTTYGTELSFTTATNSSISVADIDGNVYQLVTICNQTWTKSNLNVSKYRNGDVIPQVTDATQWAALSTGAWCYYANTSTNGTTYGKLYNWYAINDPRGISPVGFHIPTDGEWITLTSCLGGEPVAGNAMKSTTEWTYSNGVTNTNSSGFTGLPGGIRNFYGAFSFLGSESWWWSSSESSSTYGWDRSTTYSSSYVYRDDHPKTLGFSVRCIKD